MLCFHCCLFNVLNSDLGGFHPIIDPETGRVTAYKTKVGADSVFPFSAGEIKLINDGKIPAGYTKAYIVNACTIYSAETVVNVSGDIFISKKKLWSVRRALAGWAILYLNIWELQLSGAAGTLNVSITPENSNTLDGWQLFLA